MQKDFRDDKRLSFRWPKMHSITHLIESIMGKGATTNTSTDGGEALHPQTRKDFGRSNHQETAEDQVYFYLTLSFSVVC
jgi:Ser-tRNA(Ala) deacylase AlaX